ncbi:MAG: ABC transporter permease, partial [Deltaproteobacteria bacterium]|nr:ABC transporter permease [Deltaproteobacteria bacterium]
SGADAGRLDFALNLFCGLILYNVFSSCVGKAPDLVVGNRNYVKRVVFPLEVLPVAVLGSSLVDAAMSLAILIPALLIFSPKISSTLYLFPLVFIPLCAMTLGLSWFLASMGVFLRDIGQFVQVMLRLLFFLSPIFYPVSAVPEGLQKILYLNPLTSILEDGRRILIRDQSPDWIMWISVTVVSLIILQLGYVWFMKSKRAFADVV